MQFNLMDAFRQEAEELLAEIEETALTLGNDAEPAAETINRLFRAFHTIKGSAAMCDFDAISGFTHHFETLLDKVRAGEVPVTPELTRIVLAARDQIKALLGAQLGGEPVPPGSSEKLIETLSSMLQGAPAPPPGPAPAQEKEQTWEVRFRPNPGLLTCGGNPALLFRELRTLGECRIQAHCADVPALDDIQPDRCYLYWTITLETPAGENAIRDVFLFVEDGAELEIKCQGAAEQQPVTEREQEAAAGPRVAAKQSMVRVPASRLDRLVSLVGELVMNQSRLQQAASQAHNTELDGPVEEIERLVAELRDEVLGIRMMPIGSIFGRFRRLVHDLSAELGKEIELVTEGEETELDKSILDQLGDPLVHLLRNSIDHGIETAERRAERGKNTHGTIRLKAVHTGSDVVVSVEDDGRGLDPEAIRAKAIEKQLITPDAVLSPKDAVNLILLPGFSTAAEVTSVSGRGVGMDAVKRQIEALRGTLSISGEPGEGTRVSLTLPLTLAIIEGLVVAVEQNQFIIPMSAVTENVELQRAERSTKNGRNVIAVRGELIPYIDLRESFRMGGEPPAISKIVIVHHQDQRVGLVVDRVLGSHQTVIQSLGRFFRNIHVVSGATIMGDGRVALILDIAAVVRFADRLAQAAVSEQAA